MEFVHIHTHSVYSLLDGACRIPDMVSRAKENGQKALAITDHGVMYGAVEFYKECKKQGIKPIIGCEVYVAPQSRFDKSGSEAAINESAYTHLILLCKDQVLIQLKMNSLVKKLIFQSLFVRIRKDIKIFVGWLASAGPRASIVNLVLIRNPFANMQKG